ncbi:MAG: dihydrofolate reductase [Lachnospiraceae bacterium]|nr:dihydrofolate reductase [Lachnospiraceae bacterium]
MKIIAACDRKWGIGKDGKLLVSIPSDMKRFKELTVGKVIVAGRKTVATFPGGLALPERTNIILTKDPDYRLKDAVIVHDLEELSEVLSGFDTDNVFVVGGESVYAQLLDKCDMAYITRIEYEYNADAHFPDLDKDPQWEKRDESEEQTYFDLEYTFATYVKKHQ